MGLTQSRRGGNDENEPLLDDYENDDSFSIPTEGLYHQDQEFATAVPNYQTGDKELNEERRLRNLEIRLKKGEEDAEEKERRKNDIRRAGNRPYELCLVFKKGFYNSQTSWKPPVDQRKSDLFDYLRGFDESGNKLELSKYGKDKKTFYERGLMESPLIIEYFTESIWRQRTDASWFSMPGPPYNVLNFEGGEHPGFSYKDRGNHGIVDEVERGSSCYSQGLKVGWHVTAVDDYDFDDDLLRSHLRDKGQRFTITFREAKPRSKMVRAPRLNRNDIVHLICLYAYSHPMAQIAYDTERVLRERGFRCENYMSFPAGLRDQTDAKLFLLVGLDEMTTKDFAAKNHFPIELEPQIAEEWMFQMKSKLAFASRDASLKGRKVDGDTIWKRLYSPFYKHTPVDVYKERPIADDSDPTVGDMTPFKTADRAKLIIQKIEAKLRDDGADIHLDELVECDEHPLEEYFCLHEPVERDGIYEKLTWTSIFKLPLDDIRNYYGEYVGFYFGYLEFYANMLIIPSVLGLFVFIWQKATGRINGPVSAILALLMVLWAKFYYTMWVRQEYLYSVHWGQSSFEVQEDVRPQFVGQWAYSDIDGELRPYNAPKNVARANFRSNIVILTCIALLMGNLYAMIYVRKQFETKYDRDTLNGLLGVVVAIQIIIFDMLYEGLAYFLNTLENHTTDVEFDEYLIWKSFLFRFVNFYNILFYLMIFKRFDEVGCGDNSEDCLQELQVALAVIFILLIVWRNLSEIITLKFRQIYNAGFNYFDSEQDFVYIEYTLDPYGSTFEDFNELVIQFGYVAIFIVAFPLAPILALLSVMVELQIDSYKFTNLFARPAPKGARDIGSWKFIIYIIGWVATATNVALMVFMTSNLNELLDLDTDLQSRLLAFLVLEHIIIFFVVFTERGLQDPGREIKEHTRRNEYVARALKQYNEKVEDIVEVWENWKPRDVAHYFSIMAGMTYKEVAEAIKDRALDGQRLKSIGREEMKQYSNDSKAQEWFWATLEDLRSTNERDPMMLLQLAKLAEVKQKAQEIIRERNAMAAVNKQLRPLEYSDIRYLTREHEEKIEAALEKDMSDSGDRPFDFPLDVWAFGDFIQNVERSTVSFIFAEQDFEVKISSIREMLELFLQTFWIKMKEDANDLIGSSYNKMMNVLSSYVKKQLVTSPNFGRTISQQHVSQIGDILKAWGLTEDPNNYDGEGEFVVKKDEMSEAPSETFTGGEIPEMSIQDS